MKKFLSAVILTATVFTVASAQEAERGFRGGTTSVGGGNNGGNRQVIQNLESARNDIDSALYLLGRNVSRDVARKLQNSLNKIDNALDALGGNGGGHGGGGFPGGGGGDRDKLVVVSLQSSATEGTLYIGKAPSRIEALEMAQSKCRNGEYSESYCSLDENRIQTEEINSRSTRTAVCSVKSLATSGRLYTGKSISSLEAISSAQQLCRNGEYSASYCKTSPKNVRCE